MVANLSRYTDLSGRNLTYDRLYTSVPLAHWLLDRKITSVGTLQSNRKGVPNQIKQCNNREQNSYEIFWNQPDKNLNLHSYVVNTKSSGKRNVLILSTMMPIFGVSKDDQKHKPAIYKFYDFTKGGTDIVDQRIGYYTAKAKSRRWTMTSFAYVLDTCRVNASTILALNNAKDPRMQASFDFGMDLVMALCVHSLKCDRVLEPQLKFN